MGRIWRFASSATRLDVALLLGFSALDSAIDLTPDFLAGQLSLSAAAVYFVLDVLGFLPMLVLVLLVRRRMVAGRALSLPRLALYSAAAAALSLPFYFTHVSLDWRTAIHGSLAISLKFALVAGAVELHGRAVRAGAREHEARQGNARLEVELQEARARLLEAQIEPHFLFNTLANVRQLQRNDPAAGLEMLTDLIEYLETSLPSLRSESTTLEQERALLSAYLRLHRPRFGPRLRFEISFPEELLRCELPSMVLLTLVENAIKHGLAPSLEGGTIQLWAEASGPALMVTVADTGAGMAPGSGGGTGLANVRSRLALRYGDAARLTLCLNEPRGIRAALRLPLTPRLAA